MALTLSSSVADLPKVSAPDLIRLSKLGIGTVRDLLINFPVGWDFYRGPAPIAELETGDSALVIGRITSLQAKRTPKRGINLTEAMLCDDNGNALKIVWFNQSYLARQLKVGERVAVAGVVRADRFARLLELQNPLHERLDSEGPRELSELMPKYALTAGLTSRRLVSWVEAVLPLAEQFEEVIPVELRERYELLPVAEAIRQGHHPDNERLWEEARRRMAFAELLELQVAFLLERRRLQAEQAPSLPYRQEVIDAFKGAIGFELTHAQKRSIWEIYQDLERSEPMNRMLNGDVGSGKTAVAAAAVAMASAAGVQSVIMAPTELLARQHLAKFQTYLQPAFPDLQIELLVSGLPSAKRRSIRAAASEGKVDLLVGTQALLEEEVELPQLGLIVVDEQHRFGTRQRELLRRRSPNWRPHFLAMTATPIPRSLVLALYGEMALSILDELPSGRIPVKTEVIEANRRDYAYQLVRREVQAGRQGFIVCPLIEESDAVIARAASKEFERLQSEVFPDLRVALVHGRLKEKEEIMQSFRSGEVDLLVATAVIEVGMDIPNATVMMIEGADRFGLAQLHQLRGRVGRAAHQSWCLLLTDQPNPAVPERLKLLARIEDGFRLANEDLRLRGAGELMGVRQHGVSDIAMQALLNPQLVSQIRNEAEALLEADPELKLHPALYAAAQRRWKELAIS